MWTEYVDENVLGNQTTSFYVIYSFSLPCDVESFEIHQTIELLLECLIGQRVFQTPSLEILTFEWSLLNNDSQPVSAFNQIMIR